MAVINQLPQAVERTFWDNATILHAADHRFVAASLDLLERVRIHRNRFFASSWAQYETPATGMRHLAQPDARIAERQRGYTGMDPMFLSLQLNFDAGLATLRETEDIIYGKQS